MHGNNGNMRGSMNMAHGGMHANMGGGGGMNSNMAMGGMDAMGGMHGGNNLGGMPPGGLGASAAPSHTGGGNFGVPPGGFGAGGVGDFSDMLARCTPSSSILNHSQASS